MVCRAYPNWLVSQNIFIRDKLVYQVEWPSHIIVLEIYYVWNRWAAQQIQVFHGPAPEPTKTKSGKGTDHPHEKSFGEVSRILMRIGWNPMNPMNLWLKCKIRRKPVWRIKIILALMRLPFKTLVIKRLSNPYSPCLKLLLLSMTVRNTRSLNSRICPFHPEWNAIFEGLHLCMQHYLLLPVRSND